MFWWFLKIKSAFPLPVKGLIYERAIYQFDANFEDGTAQKLMN